MENLNRRTLSIAIMGGAVAAIAACGGKSDSKDTPDGALSALSNAISSLQGAVAGFSDENWRDVVPAVQADVSNVADAFAALKKTMGKE
jgi:uncharacterized protein YukE